MNTLSSDFNRLSCDQTESHLMAYQAGRLTTPQADALLAHVMACAWCHASHWTPFAERALELSDALMHAISHQLETPEQPLVLDVPRAQPTLRLVRSSPFQTGGPSPLRGSLHWGDYGGRTTLPSGCRKRRAGLPPFLRGAGGGSPLKSSGFKDVEAPPSTHTGPNGDTLPSGWHTGATSRGPGTRAPWTLQFLSGTERQELRLAADDPGAVGRAHGVVVAPEGPIGARVFATILESAESGAAFDGDHGGLPCDDDAGDFSPEHARTGNQSIENAREGGGSRGKTPKVGRGVAGAGGSSLPPVRIVAPDAVSWTRPVARTGQVLAQALASYLGTASLPRVELRLELDLLLAGGTGGAGGATGGVPGGAGGRMQDGGAAGGRVEDGTGQMGNPSAGHSHHSRGRLGATYEAAATQSVAPPTHITIQGGSLELAMAVAALSAILELPISGQTVYTGGVGRDGRITPVGSIPEKARLLSSPQRLVMPRSNLTDVPPRDDGPTLVGCLNLAEAMDQAGSSATLARDLSRPVGQTVVPRGVVEAPRDGGIPGDAGSETARHSRAARKKLRGAHLEVVGTVLPAVPVPQVLEGYRIYLTEAGEVTLEPGLHALAELLVEVTDAGHAVSLKALQAGVTVDVRALEVGETALLGGAHLLGCGAARFPFEGSRGPEDWRGAGLLRHRGSSHALRSVTAVGRDQARCEIALPDREARDNLNWRPGVLERVEDEASRARLQAITLDSFEVSAQHARLERRGADLELHALRSYPVYAIKSGTAAAARAGQAPLVICPGDEVLVGRRLFVYRGAGGQSGC